MPSAPVEQCFLAAVVPLLRQQDQSRLVERLQRDWSVPELESLLNSENQQVLQAAVVCLGMIGSMRNCQRLMELLTHSHPRVALSAENALWSIWMRAGSPDGQRQLTAAIRAMRSDRFEQALAALTDLVSREPDFAEAHHQQGLVLCLLDRPTSAAASYERALRLNPHHFAAAAGLGHIRANQGRLQIALQHYRHALRLHPGMAEIQDAVDRLQSAIVPNPAAIG